MHFGWRSLFRELLCGHNGALLYISPREWIFDLRLCRNRRLISLRVVFHGISAQEYRRIFGIWRLEWMKRRASLSIFGGIYGDIYSFSAWCYGRRKLPTVLTICYLATCRLLFGLFRHCSRQSHNDACHSYFNDIRPMGRGSSVWSLA